MAALIAFVPLVSGCEDPVPRVATTAGPSGVEAAVLAQRFAPQVWLAEGDDNFPMAATDFVTRSALRFDHGDLCDDPEPVAEGVEPKRLGEDGGYRHRAYPVPVGTQTPSCDHEAGIEYDTTDDVPAVRSSQGFYLDLDDDARSGDSTLGAPAYWERHEDGSGLVAFVYWFFYGYNDYNNKHEGDWERVAVQVRGEQPVAVTFWKHEEPTCTVDWADLDVDDGHPTVLAAKGAHGSYPTAGMFNHPGGVDITTKGRLWRAWSQVRAADAEPWWGYRGMWGEAGMKNFRGPRGPYPGREQEGVFTTRECARTTLPEGFAGDWETREPVRQVPVGPAGDYYMRLTIRENGQHEVAYSSDFDNPAPAFACSGTLSLIRMTTTTLTMRELITRTDAGNCVTEGDVVLTRTRDDLQWQYTGGSIRGDAYLVRRPG
ncbi:hypothetical protein [Actinokineospora sp. NBRC 105648]|uniref:hypothetical protein n=1 Tax=Actinokineospora sp. NBRC 105648 TaxID=3032206 RepID=UPI0025524CA0|nr:hypothetical protein [Actinokineospora sp. NBRC 105648]